MTPDASRSSRRHWVRLSLAAVATIAASLLVGMNLRPAAARASSAEAPPAVLAQHPLSVQPGQSYADLVSRVSPSIVTVRTESFVRPTRQEFMLPDDPFLRQFFGQGLEKVPAEPRRQGGLGSGVIVSEDG